MVCRLYGKNDKKMKVKFFLIHLFILGFFGCQTNDKSIINKEARHHLIEKILRNIQHYKMEPLYLLKTDAIGGYELYVNDIPVFNISDNNLSYAKTIQINSAILKSGKQKVKLKVFSKRKSEKDLAIKHPMKFLPKNSMN